MKSRLALDRLTEETRQTFPEHAGNTEFRQRVGGATIVPDAIHHLRSDDTAGADTLVRGLFPLRNHSGYHSSAARDDAARKAAADLGVSGDDAVALSDFLTHVVGAIDEIVRDQLAGYTTTQIGAVLADLYEIDEADFDPAESGELDYNADDGLPQYGATPHDYLAYLIVDTVIARLIKRSGRELFLLWADAIQAAS